MASFYSSLSGEGDMLPTAYFQNQKLDAYLSSELPSNKLYENEPSVSLSYPNFLSGGSLSAHDHVQPESIGSRDESMFIPPTRVSGGMQQIDRRLNINPHYSDGNTVTESIPQYHGLSLSLGSQEGSLVQLSSDLNQFTNSSFGSMLSSDMQSEVHLSGNNGIKNVQYLSFDLAGKAQDTVKYGDVNNFQNMISSKEMSFMPPLHHAPELGGTFCNSKYLKAAQELLNEAVNVHRDIQKSGKGQNFISVGRDGFMGTDVKRDGMSAEPQESAANELSPSERHDLQNKMTKLLSMLDEVDSRYKQYFHQMQAVVSSFDMVAGRGAAQPYTALALRTISIQFRCLRDAIKKQIQATQKSLGDQDTNSQGQGVLSRLRFVDQQLRQQKSLHQFGIMRQPWRPQRGLPETAVSVLRAWLFEHFLHPYPKDSEKLVLARQTGLSRGQVANWFINARVRLWKPMIEEMYKEEFGVAGTETKSSPEIPTANQEFSSFEERENDFHGSLFSAEAEDDGRNFMAGRHDDLMGNSTGGNQVSLALGLQQSERDSQQIGRGLQPKGKNASSSSMGLDKLEYYYVDPVNNQQRFGNRHMLSDFVA